MISFRSPSIERLEGHLAHFARRGIPYAIRNTLNDAAFDARRTWIAKLPGKFTLRNRWTERSIRVRKARGRTVGRMVATIGSTREYMLTQEEGGTETPTGHVGVPVPTARAAGQARGTRPRSKVPRRANRLRRITLSNARNRGRSRAQKNAIAISVAKRGGGRFAFLDLGRRKGIFRIMGSAKRSRIEMMWDLSHRSIRTKPTHMLEDTMDEVGARMPNMYKDALLSQLRFNGVID